MNMRAFTAVSAMLLSGALWPASVGAGVTTIAYDSNATSSSANALARPADGRLAMTAYNRLSTTRLLLRYDFDISTLGFSNQVYTNTQTGNHYSGDGHYLDATALNSGDDVFSSGGAAGGTRAGEGLAYYGGDGGGSPVLFLAYEDSTNGVTGFVELQQQSTDDGSYSVSSKWGAGLSQFSIATSETGGYLDSIRIHGTPDGGSMFRMFAGGNSATVYRFDVGALTGHSVDTDTPANSTVGTRSVTTPVALTLQDESGTTVSAGKIEGLDFDSEGDLWVLRDLGVGNWYVEEYEDQGGDVWKRLQSHHNQDDSFIPASAFVQGTTSWGNGDHAESLVIYDDGTLLVGEHGGWSGNASHNQLFKFTLAPVPEPATLALLGLGGLATAGGAVRRRRRG